MPKKRREIKEKDILELQIPPTAPGRRLPAKPTPQSGGFRLRRAQLLACIFESRLPPQGGSSVTGASNIEGNRGGSSAAAPRGAPGWNPDARPACGATHGRPHEGTEGTCHRSRSIRWHGVFVQSPQRRHLVSAVLSAALSKGPRRFFIPNSFRLCLSFFLSVLSGSFFDAAAEARTRDIIQFLRPREQKQSFLRVSRGAQLISAVRHRLCANSVREA